MLRIAICDDETAQRSLLEAYVGEWGMLQQQEVDMALVGSAEQFLFHWEERRRDILLLDIDMPGGDGLSLARRLRSQGEDVQIVFVTGLAEYALEGYDVDAVSYLIKPVEKERLFACLDKALARCGREAPRCFWTRRAGWPGCGSGISAIWRAMPMTPGCTALGKRSLSGAGRESARWRSGWSSKGKAFSSFTFSRFTAPIW